MKTLTINQQKLIIAEIARYNVRYANLKEELTDHIFCEIEELYHTGYEFEQAFIQVFDKWHPMLTPRKDFKYRHVPSFISNTWYRRDDNRWRIAGVITFLFALINSLFLKLDHTTHNISFFAISLIGLVLSILLFMKNRKRQNYRASYLILKSMVSGSILLVFTLILGIKVYGYMINGFTMGDLDLLSLVALYHCISIIVLSRENSRQRRTQIA
ncbi:hypothetical protein HX045_08045 [Myroides odoratimimus]|uniref:Uncharacterized protein n=1 Tax=Myroides odoratimimus TaxID=76832 RepID=A0A0S7EFT5_9FLAO|nr:hypothetical protein [Myroides odoratimimus]ALU27578.1 hypothetical protein AS202_16130 [Myroides odoratimimus]EKB05367.1 hypothetical protein HMPREF9711_01329 [Myroides odoratimimus CCUG 3837]MCA4793516.1 hypothetical protein [Myroides odoratimimus]MCA4820741.1 hypothetical protein [Myroides odoratimimus]MCO7722656.1 hypothetical protein [Myroides odoratimimus]